tara:strand:+ start:4835 stop:5083 length:249 start_codon:yes stop_codon:yes gene_type:complete
MGINRQGQRQTMRDLRKTSKKHIKEFYSILHELDDVAVKIKNDVDLKDVTKDNIKDIASVYTDRTIGKYETTILLSKLNIDD